MINYKSLLTFLFLILISDLKSQTNTGSPLSIIELGEINFTGNVSNTSMGGINSYNDSTEFNLLNPSSLAKLLTTNYSVGTFYKSSNVSNFNSTDKINSGNINYIAIGIPTKNFGFGFGVLPYSSSGFNLQTSNEYNIANNIDSRLFGADGSINRVFFSIGLPLFKNLSIGGTVNYNFGKLNYEKFNLYNDVNYGIYAQSSSEINGFNYLLSSNFNLPISKEVEISINYTIEPSSFLESTNSEFLYTASSSIINLNTLGDFVETDLDSRNLKKTDLLIAKSQTLGFGVKKQNNWFIGFELSQRLSSNFENKFLNIENISFRDTNSFSFGGYFIPEYSSLTSYWKRVKYIFGIKNQEKSIIINNLPINQISLNLGLGLPLSGLSKANFGLEIGKLGDDDNQLKESYFMLKLGLSLNDIWFIKRKYN